MKYRKALESDCEIINKLVQETIDTIYPKYYPKEVVSFFGELHNIDNIKKDIEAQAVWMLFDQENFVGTGTCIENHITRVFVLPQYQGKGYGSYIMEQLEQKITKNYPVAIIDASLPACQLYEKRGYETIRHETWECANGTVLVYDFMEKNLCSQQKKI